MNDQAITKFLAEEVMGWTEILPIDEEEASPKLVFAVDQSFPPRIAEFDPMNDIAHAFMVQDAIAKMDDCIQKEFSYQLERDIWIKKEPRPNVPSSDIVHATSKERCIAAVRALGTPEQQRECGL